MRTSLLFVIIILFLESKVAAHTWNKIQVRTSTESYEEIIRLVRIVVHVY